MSLFFIQNDVQHSKPNGGINEVKKLGSIEAELILVVYRWLAKLAHKDDVFSNTRGLTSDAVRRQSHTVIESD